MSTTEIPVSPTIALFVKAVTVFEGNAPGQKTVLPFFADGYPGLIHQETQGGFSVYPHIKPMPAFFLYGQTLKPVELVMEGTYRLIVFQLYPFVLRHFFGLQPKGLTDDCYDLTHYKDPKGKEMVYAIREKDSTDHRLALISAFLLELFEQQQEKLDLRIHQAIRSIIQQKGQVRIAALLDGLHMTERTFERRFMAEVGLSAKQFAKIIQFQEFLQQVALKDYDKLTDVVYTNGFADQSHFIKVFRAFTGTTPAAFGN